MAPTLHTGPSAYSARATALSVPIGRPAWAVSKTSTSLPPPANARRSERRQRREAQNIAKATHVPSARRFMSPHDFAPRTN